MKKFNQNEVVIEEEGGERVPAQIFCIPAIFDKTFDTYNWADLLRANDSWTSFAVNM